MNWIDRLKSNANDALFAIYDEFQSEAISWIKSEFKVDTVDAEEIFQASVVVLYDNVVTGKLVELTSNLKTYLFSIIKHKIIHLNRERYKISDFDALSYLKEAVYEEYKEIDQKDLDKMSRMLIRLGDPCKKLLELSFYNNMALDDITQLLGYKNKDSTKNQKYKCLKRLQNLFFE